MYQYLFSGQAMSRHFDSLPTLIVFPIWAEYRVMNLQNFVSWEIKTFAFFIVKSKLGNCLTAAWEKPLGILDDVFWYLGLGLMCTGTFGGGALEMNGSFCSVLFRILAALASLSRKSSLS